MTVQTAMQSEGAGRNPARGFKPRAGSDRLYNLALKTVAVLFAAIVAAFVWSVLHQSLPAWGKYGFGFLFGTNWAPSEDVFGAAPLLLATLITTGVALLFAVPIGIGTALVLTFVLPRKISTPLRSIVELLAAVPSVVYGLWGLSIVVPWMSHTVQPWLASFTDSKGVFSGNQLGLGLATASIVLSIMVLPTIVAVSRDVLANVPNDQIEGALSLGATRGQVITKVVLPAAKFGNLGAISLGTGRALGETVAVAMVIGQSPAMPGSLFSLGSTLASTIAGQYIDSQPMHLAALGACAVILMVLTAGVNFLARLLVRRTAGK
jgi:phosphate transport system permease protein